MRERFLPSHAQPCPSSSGSRAGPGRSTSDGGEATGCRAEILTPCWGELGRDAPPLARIRQVLEAAEQGLRLGLGARAPKTPEPAVEVVAAPGDRPAAEALPAAAAAAPVPAGMALPVTAIATREDAFRVIEAVAGWFRTAEPHSPIAYTLEEAVRRGRLPLTDLITELIRDETARRDFLIAAGIKPADAA